MVTTPILGIQEVAPTQTDKTTTINDAIVALEGALQDQLGVSFAGGDVTLSALQYTRYQVFSCSGLTNNQNLICPLTKRVFIVKNTSGTYSVTVKGATGSTVTVGANTAAEVQCDGTNMSAIVQGGTGAAGDPGGISIPYVFSSTTTNSDPGAGNLRLNNSTQGSATAIYISETGSDGGTYTGLLDNFVAGGSTEKGKIRLYDTVTPTKWIVLSVTGETTHTGYREFAVTVIATSGSNPLTNGNNTALTFTATGDAATSTTNVWSAAQRAVEQVLTYGATVTPDFSTGNNFVLTLTGNATLANPTNFPPSGQTQAGQIVIIQDGTGGHTITWGSEYYMTDGVAVQPASGANSISVFSYHARGSGPYLLVSPATNFETT